jgi:hypothetical protein
MPASSRNNEKVEPILYLLGVMIVFFTAVLLAVEYWFKEDAQVFQVIASILTGIAGAFLARIKPAGQDQPQPPPPGTEVSTATVSKQVSELPVV